jgi:hypothetical protein
MALYWIIEHKGPNTMEHVSALEAAYDEDAIQFLSKKHGIRPDQITMYYDQRQQYSIVKVCPPIGL